MVELNPLTRQHVADLFAPADVAGAEELLARECAESLPLICDASPAGLERIRFAAIRLSDGALPRLREAVALAARDWRDLLMAADFADDIQAHRIWQPRRLVPATVERWKAGELPEGVRFALNAPVQVRRGSLLGSMGAVVSLVGLEPEPRYLVGLASGRQIEVRQLNLRDAS